MIHKLCSVCLRSCKQDDNIKIVRCPNFKKRLSEDEFKDMINELDTMEHQADELGKRAKKLIRSALEFNESETESEDFDHFDE